MNKTLIAFLVVIGLAGAGGAWWFLGKELEPGTVFQGKELEPGTVFQDCPECPEIVVVPSGEFMMGSPDSEPKRLDDEGPVHRVTIPAAFAVGKYEVTFEEWDACVSAGGCNHKPRDQGWGRGRLPVITVSWDYAQEYVSWLSKKTGKTYRLLSEAEWEYVARAGTTTPFHTGEQISTSQANYNGVFTYNGSSKGENRERTIPVGSFGANQFGLHDVHGNVWEWVQDCWNTSYNGAPSDGSAWTSGNCSRRVLRGGSWSNEPQHLRSSIRSRGRSVTQGGNYGFRVARTLP